MSQAFTYIVECADGSLYTGWTTNLEQRVAVHNAGKGARYTRSRLPVKLVWWEELQDKIAAQSREARIKLLSRREKLILIQQRTEGQAAERAD
ncbi:putative endonuclease [Anaerospora hongkongensis]|jgi:putative endonuclease|uniref:Putative endonuclease n=1 Tax=Anaerospora hongkongensis TaxID=244830 RepID=A0A4R1Q1S9_9FIRM|nr:GIY-YIG nuclease family protein [Anaerospora hongkongensis]TCL38288.1 putative endonuclease [Anaerospora hongkongensis]